MATDQIFPGVTRVNAIPKVYLSVVFIVATVLSLSLPVHGNFEPQHPIKFEQFGSIPCDEERARVDNYGRHCKSCRWAWRLSLCMQVEAIRERAKFMRGCLVFDTA